MPTIPKPQISTASKLEFEVVWDGAHHNGEADLLTPIQVTPRPAPLAPKSRDTTALVEAILPTRELDAVTLMDVVRQTGMTAAAVTHALYQLRHRGRLKTAEHRPLRAPQRYWRVVDRTNDTIVVDAVRAWLRE